MVTYPCQWQYRIICSDDRAVHRLIADYAGDAPYCLTPGPGRIQGIYKDLVVEMTVYSDYHRFHLHELLTDEPSVKVVL